MEIHNFVIQVFNNSFQHSIQAIFMISKILYAFTFWQKGVNKQPKSKWI